MISNTPSPLVLQNWCNFMLRQVWYIIWSNFHAPRNTIIIHSQDATLIKTKDLNFTDHETITIHPENVTLFSKINIITKFRFPTVLQLKSVHDVHRRTLCTLYICWRCNMHNDASRVMARGMLVSRFAKTKTADEIVRWYIRDVVI